MDRRDSVKGTSGRASAHLKQSIASVNNNSGAAGANNGNTAAPSGNSPYVSSNHQNHNTSPGSSVKSNTGVGSFGKNVPRANSFRTTAGNTSTIFTSPVKSMNLPKQVPAISGVRTSTAKSVIGLTANRNFRANAERAIREHKIYSVVGVYPAVRNALKKRGWVEKLSSTTTRPSVPANNLHMESRVEDESDQAWLTRMLRDYTPDFVWVIRRDGIDWKMLNKEQIVNRFPKAFFTTKVGLAACMQNLHWFSEAGIADTFFPRCYRLCLEEEKTAFVDDYRMSACLGYLKWLVQTYEEEGERGVSDPSSKITILSVDFAVRQVNNYIRMRRHEDIDWLLSPAFMAQHWDVFLSQYTTVVQKGFSKLRSDSIVDSAKHKYEAAKRALQRVAPYWPQLHVDGIKNIWICKPGARSRGKGIVVMNSLEKIMELLSHNNFRDTNWVVQKYIERPMLVFKTKFDIRQWFIITDWSPLTVWFYKESYIRFCTKPFSLEDFHESVHLCNNAVQCRYQNSELRDSQLPDENMWDCYTFQAHLKTLGKMDEWQNIYHGMKQSIMGVLLASQETIEPRKSCFELYGADFMLSEDLRPWLIEINSCPCMAASTSVTARMCAQCLEDSIKVVLDRKEDRNADTGMFEMIYKQNLIPMTQQFTGHDLIISGTKLSRDIDWPSIMTKFGNRKSTLNNGSPARIQKSAPHRSEFENGFTFNDLIHRLRINEGVNPASYNSALLSTIHSTNARGRVHITNGRNERTIDPGSIVTVRKLQPNIETIDANATITGQPSKFIPGFPTDPSIISSTLTNRAQSIIANSNPATHNMSSKASFSRQGQSSIKKYSAPTSKRSKALYTDIGSRYQGGQIGQNALKNSNTLSKLIKNTTVANNLMADMVRSSQDSNLNALKKIVSGGRPKSPYSPVSTNNTTTRQRSRPSTAGGKPPFETSKSTPNTAAKNENELSSVEKEKYGKIRAFAHSTDSLNLITDSTESITAEINKKYSSDCNFSFNNSVLDNSEMYFQNSPSENSSTSNQVSFSEEPTLSTVTLADLSPKSISSPELNAPQPQPVPISADKTTSDKKSKDVDAELDNNDGTQATPNLTDLRTAYSQLYMIFPASPVHNFPEQEQPTNNDTSDSVVEKVDNDNQNNETQSDSKLEILDVKEPSVEAESHIEIDLIDLHTAIEPEDTEETDFKIVVEALEATDGNECNNSKILMLANDSSTDSAVVARQNPQKSDNSKRKKKKYRDFCSKCFSILCRCRTVALESHTNSYHQHHSSDVKLPTNTNNNDPVPNKFPCYRIFLEQRTPIAVSKRSAATLPLKTINLNLS